MDLQSLFSRYSELVVGMALNVQPGQRVWLKAPIETAELVRALTTAAYRRGARYVHVMYEDDRLRLARFEHAPRDSFGEYPEWEAQALARGAEKGDAFLNVFATDPELLSGQDSALVAEAEAAENLRLRDLYGYLMSTRVNWTGVSVPIPSWAARVFPGLPQEEAMVRLWEAIAQVMRLDEVDPVTAWRRHAADLQDRASRLTRTCFSALHFRGPGTDLTVGLPQGHRWIGGPAKTPGGVEFIPNMPTEEIFTLPHRDRIEGVVASSLPLVYGGRRIEGFGFEVRQGRVVRSWAREGQETLAQLLAMDEGSSRFGEVALVSASSAVARTGLLFYNTLFDENAACHLALGRAYRFCLESGDELTDEGFLASGGNDSMAHVDFMIGSPRMDVDGILPDGARQPLMREGEWAD